MAQLSENVHPNVAEATPVRAAWNSAPRKLRASQSLPAPVRPLARRTMLERKATREREGFRAKPAHRPQRKPSASLAPLPDLGHLEAMLAEAPASPAATVQFEAFKTSWDRFCSAVTATRGPETLVQALPGTARLTAAEAWCGGHAERMGSAARCLMDRLGRDVDATMEKFHQEMHTFAERVVPKVSSAVTKYLSHPDVSTNDVRRLLSVSANLMSLLTATLPSEDVGDLSAGLREKMRHVTDHLASVRSLEAETAAGLLADRLANAVCRRDATALEAGVNDARGWRITYEDVKLGPKSSRLRRELAAAEVKLHRLRCLATKGTAMNYVAALRDVVAEENIDAVSETLDDVEDLALAWATYNLDESKLSTPGPKRRLSRRRSFGGPTRCTPSEDNALREQAEEAIRGMQQEAAVVRKRLEQTRQRDVDEATARRVLSLDFENVVDMCAELRKLRQENEQLKDSGASKDDFFTPLGPRNAVARRRREVEAVFDEMRSGLRKQFHVGTHRRGSGLVEYSMPCTAGLWAELFPEAKGQKIIDVDGPVVFGLHGQKVLPEGATLRLTGPLTATFRRETFTVTGGLVVERDGVELAY